MPESTASLILFVGGPGERRERALAALGELESEVVCADDMSSAIDELSFVKPHAAVISGDLQDDAITWIIGSLGDADRAVVWVDEPRQTLFEFGVFAQVPYAAGIEALTMAVSRVAEIGRLRQHEARQRERLQRLDYIIEVVSEIRHAVSSPLTSLLAETELMLMDANGLTEEQRRSVKTMQLMSQRLRDLTRKLHELKLRPS